MTTARPYLLPLLTVVALLQSAVVVKGVYDRDRLIKTGHEIILPVIPVDPRDVFRGDYVILGYGLSPVQASLFDAADLAKVRRNTPVYVTIGRGADGAWSAKHAATTYPDKVEAGDLVLRAMVTSTWGRPPLPNTGIALRYGIESYFVPEGTGLELQNMVREKKVEAIVAVGTDGTAALKGLVVDGQKKLDPPLF